MGRHDVAFVIEQRGVGHGGSPTGTIPRVHLHAHSETVEVNLIGGPDCDFIRNLGSAVIVARFRGQSGQACAQERGQDADAGFVCGKRGPSECLSTPSRMCQISICFVRHR